MEFSDVVRRRRMVRNYSDQPVAEEQLTRILDAARRVPSAGFSQGQSFVVVTEKEMRSRIASIANEYYYISQGFDPWISKAPVLVVLCTSEKIYLDRYNEPDKRKAGDPATEWPVPYWFVDAGCSMMMLLLAAVDEGLAAGFLGLSDEGYLELRELLDIPASVTPIGLITIGHPAPDRRSSSLKRGWRLQDDVIHRERW